MLKRTAGGIDNGYRLTGDRGFESPSLQRRVCLSRDFIFGGQKPAFRAGFEAAFSARSAESRRARKHRADPQQCLCRAIFQYRISRDAVATSCWVKVARRVPKRDRACSGSRMLVDLESSD